MPSYSRRSLDREHRLRQLELVLSWLIAGWIALGMLALGIWASGL